MENDPGETVDLAAKHPEMVADLSARYEAWIDDTSGEGRRRLPLPVGHAENNPVELHAPQAFFDPSLRFASGPGFANDWLTGWTDPKAKVWFEIETPAEGDYEVSLSYACPAGDAGSRVRVSAGASSVEVELPAAEAPEIPLPHRDEAGKSRYRNRAWGEVRAETLRLPAGAVRLVIEPVAMPGAMVMDFKQIILRRK
jgi:hypothetical protein